MIDDFCKALIYNKEKGPFYDFILLNVISRATFFWST